LFSSTPEADHSSSSISIQEEHEEQKPEVGTLLDMPPSMRNEVKVDSSGVTKYELSEKQRADIKEAFETLDYDKIGFIYTRNLKIALRAMGFEPRKNDIKEMADQIDKKSTGKISYNQFLSLITSKLAEKDNREEIKKAFKLFDRDQIGKITFQNLQEIAAELGETLNEEEILEMISEADQDGDGMVSCDEFFRIMKKTSLY